MSVATILTVALLIPVSAAAWGWYDRNATAEAGHVTGLILGGGILFWFAWASVSIVWLLWQ